MARYREKNEDDLRWNDIRRRLTRELDANISQWRERELNRILAHAWDEYNKALDKGVKLAIESKYEDWVSTALTHAIEPPLETAGNEAG